MTGSKDWQRILQWLWVCLDVVELDKLAAEACTALCPQQAHSLDHLIYQTGSIGGGGSEALEFVAIATKADTHADTAFGEHVQRSELTRQVKRLMEWEHERTWQDADALGRCCHVGHRYQRVEDIGWLAVLARYFGPRGEEFVGPQAVVAAFLGDDGLTNNRVAVNRTDQVLAPLAGSGGRAEALPEAKLRASQPGADAQRRRRQGRYGI